MRLIVREDFLGWLAAGRPTLTDKQLSRFASDLWAVGGRPRKDGKREARKLSRQGIGKPAC